MSGTCQAPFVDIVLVSTSPATTTPPALPSAPGPGQLLAVAFPLGGGPVQPPATPPANTAATSAYRQPCDIQLNISFMQLEVVKLNKELASLPIWTTTAYRTKVAGQISSLQTSIAAERTLLSANNQPGVIPNDVAQLESVTGAAIGGFGTGLKTGSKAVINGAATAVVNTATLGTNKAQIELISVTPEDRAGGYDTAVAIATGAGEVLIGVGTGGLAGTLAKGGKIARAASGAITAFDAVGNATGVVTGTVEAVNQGGLTLQTGAKIVGGAFGLAGNAAAMKQLANAPSPGQLVKPPATPDCAGANCFVAGTPVLVASNGIAHVMYIGPNSLDEGTSVSESAICGIAMIGVGMALALVKSKLEEEEERKSNQPRKRRGGRKPDDVPRRRDFYEIDSNVDQPTDDGSGLIFQILPAKSARQQIERGRSWLSKSLTAAMLVCFTVGAWFGTQTLGRTRLETNAIASAPSDRATSPASVTMNIEDIRLGQRVVGRNPLREQTQPPSQIDPENWRIYQLEMIQDGTQYELAFLRPTDWADSLRNPNTGQLHFVMTEMGLDGDATIRSIDPCPELEPDDGTGRMLVTGTMKHLADNILDIQVDGESQPIGVTSTHPLWSNDQKKSVAASKLKLGERLESINGHNTVVKTIQHRISSNEVVYNLEIDGEHVYRVGNGGLLVHNDCWSTARKNYWKNELAESGDLYSEANKARMVEGKAPMMKVEIDHAKTGKQIVNVPMELHHRSIPQRAGTPKANEAWNLEATTPWGHAGMDPFRHTGYELLRIINGTNSW